MKKSGKDFAVRGEVLFLIFSLKQTGENLNILCFNRSGPFRQAVDEALHGERG